MADAATPQTVDDAAVKRLLPWLVAVAFFMQALDTTILNTAVPAIAAALGLAPLSMKAVLSSYTLSVAVFIPVSGWVADRYGTRRVFSAAIAVFTVSSLLCGLCNDIHALVACRILQGLGGAMMVPVGRLTLVRTFPKSELVRAMSIVTIPGMIGPMLGPVAGAFIVHYLNWRVIFFINLPIGLLGLFLVYRHLPDYRAERREPLDWAGVVLFSSGTALLSYVLEVFGEHTLSDREVLALLAIALALLAAYWLHAVSAAHPLLQLALFRIRTFRVAVFGSLVTRLGASGMPFLLPLLYQVGMGYTPIQAALLIIPQPLAAMSLKMALPRLLARFGYRHVLLWNTLLMGVLIMLFSTVGPSAPITQILSMALLLGFCTSLQFSSMNTLVYADVGGNDASMASTMSSTAQQLSMSFGVAVASLAAALFIPDRFRSDPSQLTHGIHWAFTTLGAITILSSLVFSELQPGDGANLSRQRGKVASRQMEE